MKMLTITNRPGAGEFCWGIEGELAVAPFIPPCSRRDCGCDRSHPGLNSHKASTALMVREVALDFDDIVTACAAHIEHCGWPEVEVEKLADEMATAAAEVAARYADGTVLRPVYDRTRLAWRYRTSGA
ncbi:MAG: hypothetical protein KDB72_20975 [Mycobacterium sp.]|nr:hypothetical protein [Mycobacterium sp.]